MKKVFIISIITVLILLSVLLIIINIKPHKKITDIKHFLYTYSNGRSLAKYQIDKKKNIYIAQITINGSQEPKEMELTKKEIKQIMKVLNKYEVDKWDKFNKVSKHVLDGTSFDLNITTQDSKIEASGYMKWPKNYQKVRDKLEEIFMDIYLENGNEIEAYKPIIYLYPEDKTDISVKLGYPKKVTYSYPKYEDGWDVIAYPNGTLIDTKTNKELYSLFWEGENTITKGIRKEGFIIKGEDAVNFLEDKLTFLGLNPKEKEEFIIYWLPKLQNNLYNYIYFETLEEQNTNMPLSVEPKPDTIIRINMEYKPLKQKIEVKEQELIKQQRQGYTLVEWGGTILK